MPIVYAIATIALVAAVVLRSSGSPDRATPSISDDPSVFVCRNGSIEQWVLGETSPRGLFDRVDCTDTFRWQLSVDFDELLTVDSTAGSSTVVFTELGETPYNLSAAIGARATFDETVRHLHPRFSSDGTVFLLDRRTVVEIQPDGSSSEIIDVFTASDFPQESAFAARQQCSGEGNLVRISTRLATMCPWGWYRQVGSQAWTFYRPVPQARLNDEHIVLSVVDDGAEVTADLFGDLSTCAEGGTSLFWIGEHLVCTATGAGLVTLDVANRGFVVQPSLPAASRPVADVIASDDGDWLLFSTSIDDPSPTKQIWRVPVGGGEPELMAAMEVDLAEGFTIFGAR